jgi:hypothetical protein
MARYKYGQFLTHSESAIFDDLYRPGEDVPRSGLYRCEGCGREIAANKDEPLPPQNHHQHTRLQGRIRWRLLVRTSPSK